MVNNATKHLARHGRCRMVVIDVQDLIPTVAAMPDKSHLDDNGRTIIDTLALVQAITSAIAAAKKEGLVPRVLVVSHLVSKPALVLPVEAIAQACKHAGLEHVCVDGAHVPGQLPLNLNRLFTSGGVDSYVGNCHKWLYAPKGTAFLAMASGSQPTPAPVVVGSEDHNCHGMDRFTYVGTRDYTSFCLVADALAFRSRWGEVALLAYSTELALWSCTYLAELWGTHYVYNGGFMINVRLPYDWVQAQQLGAWLLEHDTSSAVYRSQEQAWVRVSLPGYVTAQDVRRLGQLVQQFAADHDSE